MPHRYCFIKWIVFYFLFKDFNLVACGFLKFDWCKMLNGYVDFSFNISLRVTVVSVEMLENWGWFKWNLDYVELLYFFNLVYRTSEKADYLNFLKRHTLPNHIYIAFSVVIELIWWSNSEIHCSYASAKSATILYKQGQCWATIHQFAIFSFLIQYGNIIIICYSLLPWGKMNCCFLNAEFSL